eukprot:gnl/TRDRNA2_/TRDRNA2_148439_c0_seq1.p1 gnl/TRDRNA2_/TRDRNA2_148439_c0~~gnl/TRDRNA2_/TRDRNA2_148439_c0_seq1.p1  ORF type:complete len:360 (+),score=56.40 gnl/TRDRNA2_/TRDRNA2_148439_c0_seq1:51-1130(+)
MEAKGLRYSTERIHLRGDPAEPPKQQWYRQLVRSGAVPAVKIREEVVPESLDILYRLEQEFPDPPMGPSKDDEEHAWRLCEVSMAFNTDGSDWLHNIRPSDEEGHRQEMLRRLQWLESALAARGGPFFLGKGVTLVDAAYVGFLTRLAHNALYFKQLDIRDPVQYPHIAAWFSAMEQLPAYQSTKQDAYFEQRIYQAHPDRRSGAEACMQLGRIGSCVGEPDCRVQPEKPREPLAAGGMAALEATSRLAERHEAVIGFLLRKQAHDEASKSHAEDHLRAVAAVLAGLVDPADAVQAAGGLTAFQAGVVRHLGDLIGTPRDMSSAAAAQVRGAIEAMVSSSGSGSNQFHGKRHHEWESVD